MFRRRPMTRSASSWNGTSVLFPYTSDVENTTSSLPFFSQCLSTISVPWTLVSMVRTGASTMSLTPTAAAR